MEFSGKFFFVALTLSTLAGISHSILTWWPFFIRPNPSDIMTINLILSPVIFAFSVILPFTLMYYQTKNIHPEADLTPILTSTFFGTWIGQLISYIGIPTLIAYLGGNLYSGFNYLQFALTTVWQIIACTLSSTFFILTTAILLAHYRKRKETKHP